VRHRVPSGFNWAIHIRTVEEWRTHGEKKTCPSVTLSTTLPILSLV